MAQFPQYTEDDLLRKRASRFRWLEQEARRIRRERVIDVARAAMLASAEDRDKYLQQYERGELWRD